MPDTNGYFFVILPPHVLFLSLENQNDGVLLHSAVFTQEYVKGHVIIIILCDLEGGQSLSGHVSLTLYWIYFPTSRSTGHPFTCFIFLSHLLSFLSCPLSHHKDCRYGDTSALNTSNTSNTTICWWYLDIKHIDRNGSRMTYHLKHKKDRGESTAWQIKTSCRYISVRVNFWCNHLNRKQ